MSSIDLTNMKKYETMVNDDSDMEVIFISRWTGRSWAWRGKMNEVTDIRPARFLEAMKAQKPFMKTPLTISSRSAEPNREGLAKVEISIT